MLAPSIHGYRFAQYTLDTSRRRLLDESSQSLALSGRAFEVLVYLLEHRDRLVSKRELMDAVWPETAVEENNLTQAVSNLRRALGDTRGSSAFIATVAGRGYQFVAAASELRVVERAAVVPAQDLPPLAPQTAWPGRARSLGISVAAGALLAAVVWWAT